MSYKYMRSAQGKRLTEISHQCFLGRAVLRRGGQSLRRPSASDVRLYRRNIWAYLRWWDGPRKALSSIYQSDLGVRCMDGKVRACQWRVRKF
jgi:hypothetical protein